ncbi:MAG TPA: hypothetical protein VN032_00290, partial [Thermoanaerobaculia bacterium]|nr:hypothetical protein [Thermoanaerobaculia bacterium]
MDDGVPRHSRAGAAVDLEPEPEEEPSQGADRLCGRPALGRWKLPQAAEQGRVAPDEQGRTAASGAGGRHEDARDCRPRFPARETRDGVEPPRRAQRRERALSARGPPRQAHELAEVHEGRRHVARAAARDERFRVG